MEEYDTILLGYPVCSTILPWLLLKSHLQISCLQAILWNQNIKDEDLYEIVPEDPYTEEDLAYYTNGRADQEQNDASARPAISGGVISVPEPSCS